MKLDPLDLHRDEAGDPRAKPRGKSAGKRARTLARYLESDLQGSVTATREVLAAVKKAEAGEIDAWEQTGNVFTLRLTPRSAALESELDEVAGTTRGPVRIPLADLRAALEGWIGLLGRQSGER